METNPKHHTSAWIFAAILASPFLYLALQWNSLPSVVPLHFNIEGKPDRFGSPAELIWLLLIMFAIGFGVGWLIQNIYRIDPKRSTGQASRIMQKMAFLIVFLLTGAMLYIVYAVSGGRTVIEPKFVLAIIALFFSFLGNLMNNIKPNYFVGIRTPWTLENDVVWRRTHHLASRLWFFGGLIQAIFILLLPQEAAVVIFVTGIIILTVVPIVYSYRAYKKEVKK